jgi:hypothetical protein
VVPTTTSALLFSYGSVPTNDLSSWVVIVAVALVAPLLAQLDEERS